MLVKNFLKSKTVINATHALRSCTSRPMTALSRPEKLSLELLQHYSKMVQRFLLFRPIKFHAIFLPPRLCQLIMF